jgi:hypothetical protein
MEWRVLVNSCERYVGTTLPRLLHSLKLAGVPPAAVHVVIGESDGYSDEVSGHHVHRVPYANMDNNALIWASRDAAAYIPSTAWVFYVHDTCAVLPHFWERLKSLDMGDAAAVRVNGSGPSMCIGAYSVAALRSPKVREALTALKSVDTSPGAVLAVKQNLGMLEDYVFVLLASAHFENVARVDVDEDVYGTGVPRIAETYHTPGVVKYKANWKLPVHIDM